MVNIKKVLCEISPISSNNLSDRKRKTIRSIFRNLNSFEKLLPPSVKQNIKKSCMSQDK